MMLYLIKSSAVLLALLLFYKLFLEKEKAFVFNRIYLLSAIALSLIGPFISYEVSLEWAEIILPEQSLLNTNVVVSTNPEQVAISSKINWSFILFLGYSLGLTGMFVKFNKNLYRLINRCKKAKSINIDGYKVIIQGKKTIPYSFFHNIFIPKDAAPEILEHEKRHVDAYHSIDVIFSELLLIVFWFNPLFHWHKKLLSQNHEFFADASPNNIDLKKYKLLIYNQIYKNKANSLASGFDSSIIKKRMIMLQKSKSGPLLWAKKLMVLPLFTLLIFAACEKVVSQEKVPTNSTEPIQVELLIQVDGKTKNNVFIFYKDMKNPISLTNAKELFQKMSLTDMDDLSFEINSKKYEGSKLTSIEFTQQQEELFMRQLKPPSGILKLTTKKEPTGRKTRAIKLSNGENRSANYTGSQVPPPPPPPAPPAPAPETQAPTGISMPTPPKAPSSIKAPAPPAPPSSFVIPEPSKLPQPSIAPPPPPPPPAPPKTLEEINYHIKHIETDLYNHENGTRKLSEEELKRSQELLKMLQEKKKEIKE